MTSDRVGEERGGGTAERMELLAVRWEVKSVLDRMKLDVERPELRCRARDADYRATLERALERIDRLEATA